jgi:conjugal transfer mating pair stabilization protein TraN
LAFEEEKCNLIKSKVCVVDGERIIDGYPTNQCWKFEQIETCISKEKNHCFLYEQNRNCQELSSDCLDKSSAFGLCKTQEKKFVCGSKQAEQPETKHLGTRYDITRDEKDLSACSKHEIDKHCEVIDEVCVEGPATRNISGKDVYKACWKWDKKYICTNDTFIDECKEMPANCKELSKTCLHTNPKLGICDHYEHQYACSEDQSITRECVAYKACHGGVCQTKTRHQHNDFGKSISYLTMLASMKNDEMDGCKCRNGQAECKSAGEIDPGSCKFFTGKHNECRKHTGHFNCCSEKGFIRQVFKCNQAELDFHEQRKAGFCHHYYTKIGKGLELLKSWQHDCCFKSKLAKIIQVQGKKQLNIDWDESCRALTLDELKRIDFTEIDFRDLFGDFLTRAQTGVNKNIQKMNDKVDEYRDVKYMPGKNNPTDPLKVEEETPKAIRDNLGTNSDLIKNKIHNFYGGRK